VPAPPVENPAHEITKLFGLDRKICNFSGSRIDLNTCYELQILYIKTNEEIEYFIGIL
jgi:hypothetical protein